MGRSSAYPFLLFSILIVFLARLLAADFPARIASTCWLRASRTFPPGDRPARDGISEIP
jgi:hypothetical protein